MAHTIENFVEGWTERITETLLADGVAQDLTNMTVELVLYDCNGALVDYDGESDILTADEGKVYFEPAATDLVASKSPYKARWKITDASSKVAYWPSGPSNAAPITWNVYKP